MSQSAIHEQAYQDNLNAVKDFDSALLWQWFAKICAIPHPSHHEEPLANYIVDWAKSQGLSVRRDDVGNVFIVKPATEGMQDRASIALQAHLDMVPQANEGTKHDFATDPIRLRLNPADSDWLMATGTTLGADNGIGMASCLAVLESQDIAHPQIEVLLTMTEETGMVGVFGLQPNELESGLMINTDTEEIGEVYIGCAGGVDADIRLPVAMTSQGFDGELSLTLKGLKGGHSGLDIHKNNSNAIKLIGRVLATLREEWQDKFAIASIKGGTLRNAIPREASVCLSCAKTDLAGIKSALEDIVAAIAKEITKAEPKFVSILEDAQVSQQVADADSTNRIIDLVNALPSGVIRHSDVAVDTVETSLSFGVLNLQDSVLTATLLVRSLVESGKHGVCTTLQSVANLAGATAEFSGAYVGWNPDENSVITALTMKEYAKLLGREADIKVIHAGLECGLIKQSYPDMDIVSIGPTIKNAHSPDEMVHIDSVNTYWQLLVQVLANAPKAQ